MGRLSDQSRKPERNMRAIWSYAKETPCESYEMMCAQFQWQIPETFNFAADVVDRWGL